MKKFIGIALAAVLAATAALGAAAAPSADAAGGIPSDATGLPEYLFEDIFEYLASASTTPIVVQITGNTSSGDSSGASSGGSATTRPGYTAAPTTTAPIGAVYVASSTVTTATGAQIGIIDLITNQTGITTGIVANADTTYSNVAIGEAKSAGLPASVAAIIAAADSTGSTAGIPGANGARALSSHAIRNDFGAKTYTLYASSVSAANGTVRVAYYNNANNTWSIIACTVNADGTINFTAPYSGTVVILA
ncbi:MAG: hypothetical protein Q4E57_07430 [Eubacteriales bacterium]|nr:hypothetical protein [Eubacteriales bacterium]